MSDNAAAPLEELLKQLNAKQVRKAMRGAYGAAARKATKIARTKLSSKGVKVQGLRSDWEKGIRPYVYSGLGGFMVTVKGVKGKSMHVNRRLDKKPVLMWLEDGTDKRRTKSASKFWRRKRSGHNTGAVTKALHVLSESESAMLSVVESDLGSEIEKKATNIIKKAGLKV